MQILAAGDDTAKIVVVIIAVAVVAVLVVWKVYAVAKAARLKSNPDEKQKAVGKAIFGGGEAYGAGYDLGKKAGEKLGSLLKRKGK